MRRLGGLYDHPDQLEFRYRFRNYIMGRNEGSPVEGGNTEDDSLEYDLQEHHVGEILLSGNCFAPLTENTNFDERPISSETQEEIYELKYDAIEHIESSSHKI